MTTSLPAATCAGHLGAVVFLGADGVADVLAIQPLRAGMSGVLDPRDGLVLRTVSTGIEPLAATALRLTLLAAARQVAMTYGRTHEFGRILGALHLSSVLARKKLFLDHF